MESIRDSFKYYKMKKPPPSVTKVIDFHNPEENTEVEETPFIIARVLNHELLNPKIPLVAGLQPVESWKAYQLKSYPGFVFISNPFTPGYQRYWVKRCLHDYPVKPNKTNLDIHMKLTENDNIWESGQRESLTEKTLIQKLRWTTLGYHHDWDTKIYSEENFTEIPKDLSYISAFIASTLGYEHYTSEAAIINYYHMDSTLGPHNDHSELDHEAPLISISFGQSAIFLLGGKEKDDEAVAMYLKSGDIAVMYGPNRLNYHAVPKIINDHTSEIHQCFQYEKSLEQGSPSHECSMTSNKSDLPELQKTHNLTENYKISGGDLHESSTDFNNINDSINSAMVQILQENWTPYEEYLINGRINMNIRQVYKLKDKLEPDKYLCPKRQKLN